MNKAAIVWILIVSIFLFPPFSLLPQPVHADVSKVSAFVTRFYQECLDRDPDPEGLNSWVAGLQSGALTGANVASGFVLSDEFKNRNVTDTEYVTILYKAIFNRDPDPAGYANWMSALENGMSRYYVLAGFTNSQEFSDLAVSYGINPDNLILTDPADLHPAITKLVTQFYKQCLNRMPDSIGLNHWVRELQSLKQTGADVAYGFVFSQEFLNRNVTNEEYVTILYKAYFNRDTDPAGYSHWLDKLATEGSRYSILSGFTKSQEFSNHCVSAGIIAIDQFDAKLPNSIKESLRYTAYSIPRDYILITASSAYIRRLPDLSSSSIGTAGHYEKVPIVALVKGKYSATYHTGMYYEVIQNKNGRSIHGYILVAFAEQRTFQFQKMADAIARCEAEVGSNLTAYISNYKNWSGLPPLHQGSTLDAFGERRDQSAPAYFQASTSSDFRYMSDGTLVSIIGETSEFYVVRALTFEGDYHVPKKYANLSNSIDQLKQVIVVDRRFQNEGVFEFKNNHWNLISYTYATTGETAQYKLPTPLGYYMAIQKSDKFIYLDDVTRKIDGYAPYVVRFSGGAYIHGVPVSFQSGQVVNERIIAYPPMQEYLSSIGTVPRSHKCVRNYTSHAKFIYEWVNIGSCAVIIIE